VIYGVYEVVEGFTYRGHASGERFEAKTDRLAEQRFIRRGVIRLIDTYEPALLPGSYTFPAGWTTETREGLFHGKE
jgi:hypothetical protein